MLKIVSISLIILLVVITNGCIREQRETIEFTIPLIRSGEIGEYISKTEFTRENQFFEIVGYVEDVMDGFGIKHTALEIKCKTYHLGKTPDGDDPVYLYLDATTLGVIQINDTKIRGGELFGVVWYSDLFLSAPYLDINAILRFLYLQNTETKLTQNKPSEAEVNGVKMSFNLIGQEDIQYIIEVKYRIEQERFEVVERYWMEHSIFPVKISQTIYNPNITLSTEIMRINHTLGKREISGVCNSEHDTTHHHLAVPSSWNKYPADGSECELDLPLSSAISEAYNSSDGFRAYLQKYPEAHLLFGQYNISDKRDIYLTWKSLHRIVSWWLTFVDPHSKTTYLISVFKEIYLGLPQASFVSVKDEGEGDIGDDVHIHQREKLPREVLTIQSAINIARSTASHPLDIGQVTWSIILLPEIYSDYNPTILYVIQYAERLGTYPSLDLITTWVIIDPVSGMILGWSRWRLP